MGNRSNYATLSPAEKGLFERRVARAYKDKHIPMQDLMRMFRLTDDSIRKIALANNVPLRQPEQVRARKKSKKKILGRETAGRAALAKRPSSRKYIVADCQGERTS